MTVFSPVVEVHPDQPITLLREIFLEAENYAPKVETRAYMVSTIAGGYVPRDGKTYVLDGVEYIGLTGATIIPDLPGMTHGIDGVAPDHFGGKSRAHILAAWAHFATVGATGTGADFPALSVVPFLFLGGRYNRDSLSALVLETTGAGQRIEFRGNALVLNTSIVVRRKNTEIINPYLVGDLNIDNGILFEPNPGESFRGGFVVSPRIYNIRNATKTGASIRARGNATHINVTDGWLQGSDYNYISHAAEDFGSPGGVLFNGVQMFGALKNNVRLSSGGENRFENARIRGAQEEGVLITGTADQAALEQYFVNCGITGNHQDLTTRENWPITSIVDNGAGKARMFITGPHKLWQGLRSLRISGTGVSAYDDATDVRSLVVTDTYIDTNLDYVSGATGTLIHCGWDVRLQSDTLLGQVNDIMFSACNINSLGLFEAYNISFTGVRMKVNAWAEGCNRITRIGGFRGREGDPSWDNVPFVGSASGFAEIGQSVPEGANRFTTPTFVMRCPLASAGLIGNMPASYASVGVNSDRGVLIDGLVSLENQATQLKGNDAAMQLALNSVSTKRALRSSVRAASIVSTEAAWEPITGLGAKLVAWWDVDTYSTLMVDDGGGLISSWTDRVLGRALTATGTARPTYQATGLYGRPCVSFDGVANALSTSTLTGFPSGSAAGGLVAVTGPWVAAATTHAAGYGSTSTNASRRISTNTGGTVIASNGTTAQTGTTANNALNVLIGEWNVTTASLYQNGVTSSDSPEAVTMATAAGFFRMAASLAATPNQFTAVRITDVMVISGVLTHYERRKLESFLAHKRGAPNVLPATHAFAGYPPRAAVAKPSPYKLRYATTGNERMSGASEPVGVYTGFKGRVINKIGEDDVSEVQIGFSNWYIDNVAGAGAETDNPDAVTISKVAVVYDGVVVPVTFNSGSRSVVLAAGETLKLSDVISATSFGFDRFKAGTLFQVRFMGTLAGAGSRMLFNARDPNDFGNAQREQAFWYNPAFAVDDVDAAGTMATPSGNQGSLIISPTAILGKYDSAVPVIEAFSDSIPHGLRDFYSGGWSTNGVGGANSKVNGGGWVRRALGGLEMGYSLTSKVGHRYEHMAANYAKRSAFFQYSTHALFTLGTNDLNGGISAADIMADAAPIWAAYRAAGGQAVLHATILPRVEEDDWAATDLEHQVHLAGYEPGGERDKLNAALRNSRASTLEELIDIARPVSDQYDPSKWAIPNYRSALAVASLSTDTTLTLSDPPTVEMGLIVDPGLATVDKAAFNVLSVAGNVATFSAAPLAAGHGAGSVVKASLAPDGTHPSAQAHRLMAQEAIAAFVLLEGAS